MSKISELSDGGAIQSGDTLIAVRSGGNVKVTYGGTTTANIDGGTIDGTVIGGSSAAAGTFTTVTASSSATIASNLFFNSTSGAMRFGTDAGTEKATIRLSGNDLKFENSSGLQRLLVKDAGGLDVTGTVTADGLTVDGNASLSAGNVTFTLFETDTTDLNTRFRQNGGALLVRTTSDDGATDITRMSIDHSTGDLSLFEDTGTTAKFFWDASAESLGIGTSSPALKGHINGASNGLPATSGTTQTNGVLRLSSSATSGIIDFGMNSANPWIQATDSSGLNNNYNLLLNPNGGNVGIGTTSPTVSYGTGLHIHSGTTGSSIHLTDPTSGALVTDGTEIAHYGVDTYLFNRESTGTLRFHVAGSERMRIDASGNLLVGKTSADGSAGVQVSGDGYIYAIANGAQSGYFRRLTSDGEIVRFLKDTTTVGSIGNAGSALYVAGGSSGVYLGTTGVAPTTGTGALVDNTRVLGTASYRWSTVYAGTGTINTSDRNDKTEIVDISEAELRVAQACKGLMKRFKFKDAVETKGDNARYHFGIIAQDLKAAFEAEGLNAEQYACFCSDTWTDEETGEERTRLGVRYEELLAFIIAAI